MPTLTLDTIEGAELQDSGDQGRIRVRTGLITGMDVNPGDSDHTVLERALAVSGMPTLRQQWPDNPFLILNRIGIIGLSNDVLRVRLQYEPVSFAGLPAATAFILTDDTTTIEEESSIHPTGTACRTTWTSGGVSITNIPHTFRVFKPLREIRISAIKLGQPDHQKNISGSVNDSEWPVGMGALPKGYWYVNRFRTTLSRYSGYFQLEASAITRVTRNWMLESLPVDPSTGKYLKVSNIEINAAITRPYEYAFVSGLLGGIGLYGPGPLASFPDSFGFGGT